MMCLGLWHAHRDPVAQRWASLDGCPNRVVVDEAHTCVVDATQRAGRSRMLRHELVRRMAKVG